MNHDQVVTEYYLAGENTLEYNETYWDDIFRETTYFEGYEDPIDSVQDKGRAVGEFDVLYVNWEDQRALYQEMKTSYGDLSKARDQLERADDFFDDWDILGQVILEP